MKSWFLAIMLSGIITTICEAQEKENIYLLYEGSKEKIMVAVQIANEVLRNPDFYKKIRELTKFDNTDSTPVQIADRLENSVDTIRVVAKYMPIANAKALDQYEIKVSKKKFSSN